MHVRLGDVLDDDGDIKIPGSDGLVIGSRDEASVLVHECNRVDGSKVLVVLLSDLS